VTCDPTSHPATDHLRSAGQDRPLRVRELEVSYGGRLRVLRGVSLSAPVGTVVAVLGGNGAGKTTLLRAISGTLPFHGGSVDGGTVELAGRPLERLDPAAFVRAGVVQVPEGRQVFGDLTVEENLRAGVAGGAARPLPGGGAGPARAHLPAGAPRGPGGGAGCVRAGGGGPQRALSEVSFTVRPPTTHALVGPRRRPPASSPFTP
jgi:ABC-type Fe3+/spermidine/putrescine transport system ATPase subunit